MAVLTAYDPSACGCCDCPPPFVGVETRITSVVRYGYLAIDLSDAYYRTVMSRGWGAVSSDGAVQNRVNCTQKAFDSMVVTYSGECDSKLWGVDWDYPPPPPDRLIGASTSCDDGYFPFAPLVDGAEIESATSMLAAPLTNAYSGVIHGPRGRETLAGLVTAEIAIAEAVKLAQAKLVAGDWAAGTEPKAIYRELYDPGTGALEGAEITNTRYAVSASGRPKSGAGYRVTWEVWWTPRTWEDGAWVDGESELIEECAWDWDGVDGIVSDWFELPQPTENGYYSVEEVKGVCAPARTLEPPDGGEALAA